MTDGLTDAYLGNNLNRFNINIIASVGNRWELGGNNKLLWYLSDDLKRFKRMTLGSTLIMGRKTFESLGKKPLPGRDNFIVSSHFDPYHYTSLLRAIQMCRTKDIYLIGGTSIFNEGLNYATTMYLTQVFEEYPEADVFFPPFDEELWDLVEKGPIQEENGLQFMYMKYIKNFGSILKDG